MNDSERYMLIFSLILFFGLMALGLVVIHGTSRTEDAIKNMNSQLATLAKTSAERKQNALTCYKNADLEKFISDKTEGERYMQFLSAQTSDNNDIKVYLDAAPGGSGSYFIIKSSADSEGKQEGCVLAEGEGMKVAIEAPEPDSISETVTEAVEEAVKETSGGPVEETIEAVESAIEESTEAAEEAVKNAAESLQEKAEPATAAQ